MSFMARQFGRPRGLFGRLAGQFMARRNAPLNRWLVQQLSELSSSGAKRIAELGPGPGIGLQALLTTFPEAQVWGVDLSPVMLAQARKRNLEAAKSGRLTLVEGDPTSLSRLAPLDLVVATHVLYFWHQPATELAQIHGALRPAGSLALGYQLRQNMPAAARNSFPKEGHVLYESDEELAKLVREAGFKSVRFVIKGATEAPQGRLALATA